MEERWLQKEKKTWFKIIKKGIVLNCAALLIGGGLMIASPAMASFNIDATTVTTPQVLDSDNDSGVITNSGTLAVTDETYAVQLSGFKYGLNLSNDGTITANATNNALAVSISSVMDSNVSNSGTIAVESSGDSTTATGIGFFSLDATSTISNTGTIEVTSGEDSNSYGISVEDNDGTITNSGALNVSKDSYYGSGDAAGMSVYQNSGTITNSGTMSVNSNSYYGYVAAVGISVEYNDGTITNSGNMNVTSDSDYSSGDAAVGVEVGSNNGTIVNSDTITVAGESYAAGIVVDGESYGLVENSGTLSVTSADGDAYGIYVEDNYDTVSNVGTVTVTSAGEDAVGIRVYDNEGEDSVVENSGTILVTNTDGDAYGIAVEDSNYGTVSNSSTITVTGNEDAIGLYVYDNYGLVENSGTLTVTSTDRYAHAYGIYVENNYDTVSNIGTITVTSAGEDAVGIRVYDNEYEDSVVENSGTITVTNTYGDAAGIVVDEDTYGTVSNSSAITVTAREDAFGLYVDDNYATIVNSGTLTVTSTEGDAYGIYIEDDNEGTVTNSGTITVTSTQGDAYGIYIEDDNDGTVTNSGTITATSTTAGAKGIHVDDSFGLIENEAGGTITVSSANGEDAIGIFAKDSVDDEITNSGTISVTQTGSSDGYTDLYVAGILKGSAGPSYNYASGVINNSGSVTVVGVADAVVIGVGAIVGEDFGEDFVPNIINNTGLIRVEGGESRVGAGILNASYAPYSYGIVNNSGTVEVVSSTGELHAEGFSVYAPSSVVTNTGSLAGNLFVGDLDNQGMVRLPVAQGQVVGDFEQSADGVLGITLFSDDDADADYNIEYSQLSVGGAVVLDDGTTVDVDVKTAVGHQSLLINKTLEGVITGEDGITVDLGRLEVEDNSALLGFEAFLSAEDSSLDLGVFKDVTVVEATLKSGERDVVGAAGVFDTLLDKGAGDDPELNDFLDNLVGLDSEGKVANAVLQASPVVAGALPSLNTQLFKTFNTIIQARQRSVRGFNSGDVVFSDNNLWAKPFGSYAEQDNDGATRGFVARSYGIGIGADGEYAPNKRAGVGFFYSNSDVDMNDVRQDADVDSFNLLAYGSNQIVDETIELFYQLGFGLQQMDTSRYVGALSASADADYTAKSIYAELKGVKTLEVNDNFRTLLALGLSYTYFDSPSYREKGLGGLGLKVDSFDADSLIIEAQADFIYSLTNNLELMANLGIGYDVIDDDVTIHSSFQGASNQTFVTKGIDSNPFVYQAGLGVAQNLRDDLSIDLNYDLEGRGSDFSSHTVSAKLNWKF